MAPHVLLGVAAHLGLDLARQGLGEGQRVFLPIARSLARHRAHHPQGITQGADPYGTGEEERCAGRQVEHGDRLGDLADLVQSGLQIPESRYDGARRHIDTCKQKMAELYQYTPVIAVPAATGTAPHGLGSTGDPTMNAPWTALGMPAISIPMPVGDELPLGLQLTAAHGNEALLLRTAERVAEIMAAA